MYCSLPQKVSCSFLACNKSQDFLCKGNDNAAWKGQKAVSSLGRVVGFERKTNLPAKRLLKELGIKDTDKEVKARIVVWYQNKQSDLLFSQT